MSPWKTLWEHEYPGSHKYEMRLRVFESVAGEILNASLEWEIQKGSRNYFDEMPIGVEGLKSLIKSLEGVKI